MNARQAADVERWAAEDGHVPGQLELVADGDPCALCRRPTRQWSDLCDDCNDAFEDLAASLDPRDGEEELDMDAVLAAVRSGDLTGIRTLDLVDALKVRTLTVAQSDLITGELGRRA